MAERGRSRQASHLAAGAAVNPIQTVEENAPRAPRPLQRPDPTAPGAERKSTPSAAAPAAARSSSRRARRRSGSLRTPAAPIAGRTRALEAKVPRPRRHRSRRTSSCRSGSRSRRRRGLHARLLEPVGAQRLEMGARWWHVPCPAKWFASDACPPPSAAANPSTGWSRLPRSHQSPAVPLGADRRARPAGAPPRQRAQAAAGRDAPPVRARVRVRPGCEASCRTYLAA